MAESTIQFRAALHGYNREDVVDYVDRMTQEHEDTVQRLQKSITKLREELEEANEAASHAKSGPEPGSTSLENQAMIAELRKTNDGMKERIEELEEELEQARAERSSSDSESFDAELERLQEENEGLRSELRAVNEALAAARGNAEAEKELTDARFLIGELRGSEETQKERIRSLETELGQIREAWKNEMNSVTQTHEELVASLRDENHNLQSELDAANEALATAQGNSDVENKLLESKLKIEDLHFQNEAMEKQMEALRTELNNVTQDNETLRNRVRELEEEAVRMQAARIETEDASKQLQEDAMQMLRTENDALREELAAANDTLAAVRENGDAEDAQMESALEELRTQNQTLEEELQALRQAHDETSQTNEALREQLACDKAELEQLRAACEAAKAAEERTLPAEPERNYAELELEAYRRAEQTERLARERAEQTERQACEHAEQTERQARAHAEDVYRQVQSVFGQANENMNGCHADLEQLCRTMSENVNEMLSVLTKLNGSYRQTEEAFAELGERNRAALEV